MNNLSILKPFISEDRASTYHRYSPNNDVTALSLYCWNIEISSELFKIISSFEVYLGNAILTMMEKAISNGIFNITFLGSLTLDHRRSIFKVLRRIDSSITFNPNINVSRTNLIPLLNERHKGKIASEMNLFFREDLFNNQVAISSITLRDGFPYLSDDKSGDDIKNIISNIRKIRNRICHNEHLLNENIKDVLNRIFELLSYISPELAEFEREKENVSCFLKLKPI